MRHKDVVTGSPHRCRLVESLLILVDKGKSLIVPVLDEGGQGIFDVLAQLVVSGPDTVLALYSEALWGRDKTLPEIRLLFRIDELDDERLALFRRQSRLSGLER